MSQLRPNCTELRSMDYYHQIFCRFRKCKRKVPPPSLLSNDFEKSCFSSAIFSSDCFSKLTFLNFGCFDIQVICICNQLNQISYSSALRQLICLFVFTGQKKKILPDLPQPARMLKPRRSGTILKKH